MKPFVNGLCFLVVVAASALLLADPKESPEKARNPLMVKKLASAQKVLEGVAVRDFELIERNADELILMSKKAEWLVLKTPQYSLHSNDFRRNAQALIEAAKEKNLDGAALAYVQLTMNCVNCHKHVREVRVADTDAERRAPKLARGSFSE